MPLRPCTIVVGRNNAGKSTLVDALRLVSIVTARYQSLTFRDPPGWGTFSRREVGVAPSMKGMGFNTRNLFHRYGSGPAIIAASFDNGASTKIFIGEEAHLHAVIYAPDGTIVRSKGRAQGNLLPRVEIMPQVAPLATEENVLSPDHIRSNLSSSLAPLHFRNQLNLFRERFSTFQQLSEETWPGLQVRELEGIRGMPGSPLRLMVRNDDFVAEVAMMGHGLQMWLQTILTVKRFH